MPDREKGTPQVTTVKTKDSAAHMSAPPIQAIVVQPDNSYEIREIKQDLATFKSLVGGGYLEAVYTYCCTIWCNEEGIRLEMPINPIATYLWWTLEPEMADRDIIRGPVFITGLADEAADSLPVPDDVIDVFQRVAQLTKDR